MRMFKRERSIGIILISSLMFLSLELAGYYLGTRKAASHDQGQSSKKKISMDLTMLRARNTVLRQRLEGLVPLGTYIVIDTGRNRLYLKRGVHAVLEAVISSGSGNILIDPSSKRQWVFDTPRGVYQVLKKYRSPVWKKPDWAFIEEGTAIPRNPRDRIEEGVLGDYALDFGDGFLIHGTLYTRLLGRNVTHGCIRLDDGDLKVVYNAANLGTRIYIF